VPAAAAPSPIERRVIILVAMVQLVNVLDFVMVMPLGQDFARALGIDEARLGWIGGSYTMAAAISGLVSARFLDRFDRRKALAVAMLGLVCATAAGGMAQGLPSMMAARIVAGMFGGPATSLSLAIIADVVPPERRGKAMGVVMASFSIASVLGVPAGLAAAQAGSWRTPFFGLAVLGLGVTFYAVSRLPSLRLHMQGTRPKSTPTFELLKRREMQLMLAAAGAMTFSIFMIVPYVRSFIVNNYGYPDDEVMFLYLAGGTGSFLVVQFTGRAVDRLGSTPVAALGTILVTVCLLVGFLPAHPIVPVMAVFTLYMSTASLRGVPISTLASRIPAPHERAQFMSMQSATQHISSSIGAIGAAQILATDPVDHRLLHMPIAVATACLVSLSVPFLLWQVERRVRARVAETAATAPPVGAVARNDDGAAEAAPFA
jgi:predicted MFS family arabinose efflux permease